MDFDLEIISEEGDCPDPLFNSIMNAMNSMKEATADKIYQKIQREGETNYSKPQVDRALESALKYGIFEVRNNRYRVRDDIIDDEDTVYWKLQKKREQTPFRIHESNEKNYGPRLDPARDNLRFKKIENNECPQCGRLKRGGRDRDAKSSKKPQRSDYSKKRRKHSKKRRAHNKSRETLVEDMLKTEPKRKLRSESLSDDERSSKVKITRGNKSNHFKPFFDQLEQGYFSRGKTEETPQERGKYDSSDSEAESLSSPSEDEQSFHNYPKGKDPNKNSLFSSNCDDLDSADNQMTGANGSSISIKSATDSEESKTISLSADGSLSKTQDDFFESLPGTSKNATARNRNQYMDSPSLYSKEYGRGQMDHCERKSDWLGCSDEPQGTIIQTNNILTIEPMDSLAFKSPEQASYIS